MSIQLAEVGFESPSRNFVSRPLAIFTSLQEKTSMSRISFVAAIVSVSAWGALACAGHHHNSCACSGTAVTQTGPMAESNPPVAPQQGQTVMNRSVEPTTSPVASQPGTGYYYSSSASASSAPYSRVRRYEIRHQHIRSHFYSMDH
jgi:hypothetical protein